MSAGQTRSRCLAGAFRATRGYALAIAVCALYVTDVNGQGRATRARTSSIHWVDVPIGEGFGRIAGNFRAAILLDRRVDPTRKISLDTKNADLTASMQQACAAAGLGVSRMGDLYYAGPQDTTELLRTLVALRAAELATLSAETRDDWSAKRPIAWPRRTTPRNILTGIVAERGWRIARAEQIPHDLWRAGALPAMTAAEQLTVLLAGFDLTFQLDAATKSVRIVPIDPENVFVRQSYPWRYGVADFERVRGEFPSLRMEMAGGAAVATGRVEDLERLAERFAGPQATAPVRRPPPIGKSVYTLRVQEQPVRAILNTLSARLNWQIEVDETALQAAGRSLDTRVSFDVRDAGEEDLLDTVLRQAGLTYRREGVRIVVLPWSGADGQ